MGHMVPEIIMEATEEVLEVAIATVLIPVLEMVVASFQTEVENLVENPAAMESLEVEGIMEIVDLVIQMVGASEIQTTQAVEHLDEHYVNQIGNHTS